MNRRMTLPSTLREALSVLKRNNKMKVRVDVSTTLELRLSSLVGGTCWAALRFHNTDIVEYLPDLNTDLYMREHDTISTRNKINRALYGTPFFLRRYRGGTYVTVPEYDAIHTKRECFVPFQDGIRIHNESSLILDGKTIWELKHQLP